ncbi:MAG: hypothetical protein FJ318_01810 [SAR202 cluster bacterium]|nr:hypothetical protein [SAR202 cluster bacterium]
MHTSLTAHAVRLLAASMLMLAVVPAFAACGLLRDDGFIAYTVGAEGQRDIAIVRPTGLEGRTVIGTRGDDFNPVWSADRQRIAFLSDLPGNVEVYVAPADGSSTMRVTNTGVDETQIAWSPDGRFLAYTSRNSEGLPKVYWVDLTNLRPQPLNFGPASDTDPAWSPNGRWVAFAELDDTGESIGLFLRNPEGVNRVQLTQGNDRGPKWSPDGKRIAFVSDRNGNQDVYVMQVSGDGIASTPVRVTEGAGNDFSPSWAPNSRRLTFLSDRNGNVDVFTVSLKGEDTRELTRNDVDELDVVWGPNGQIVFSTLLTTKADLFIMNGDGGEQAQLTHASVPSQQPDWR